MMLVAVVSLKGSPGVTTFSVALAARWPAPAHCVLVEADPAGGDVGMRFSLRSTPGLLSLAAAARRGTDPMLVWQHAQGLPGDLPVVAAPPDADLARGALSALVSDPESGSGVLRAAADLPGAVVVADCGRVAAGSAAMPVVRAADVMVLLTGAGADDLAHLARRVPEIGGWSPHPVLLLAGPGHSMAEVARELGVTPLGRIPRDTRGAEVLSGRRAELRWHRNGPTRSALGQFAHQVATILAAQHPAAPVHRPRPGPTLVAAGTAVDGAFPPAGRPFTSVGADGTEATPARRRGTRRDRDEDAWPSTRGGAAS